ncbi:MAG TPA: isoprenylcysteine carboxylmethyltransferase family protein [Arcobacter sp.]|nr:isoprenylcysteine carboxylmethyltransferase family protein [Arcobacter sp.]
MFKANYSGYFGALFLFICAFIYAITKKYYNIDSSFNVLFLIFTTTLLAMIFYEYKANNISILKSNYINQKLFKSTIYRYLALSLPYIVIFIIVSLLNYYTNNSLKLAQIFFSYILFGYLLFGIPYIYFTLKYNSNSKYEFNDYGILLLIALKSIYKKIFSKNYQYNFFANHRVIKVVLAFAVNFFFVKLMVLFFSNEFNGFYKAFDNLTTESFYNKDWYIIYKNYFLFFFHLIFIIDVGIATIGYTVANRWLNNRTKSVDFTFLGWGVALICYPPFNSFASQFIGYHSYDTYQIFTNHYALAIILALVLALYTIYVWSTVTLGFKFSNLTNRGIVTNGPFKYVRHPAYSAKNIAWWVDNTFVLTNIWATLSLLAWNIIYILRGTTEEKHLQKDKKYKEYQEKVKYRFIPKVI